MSETDYKAPEYRSRTIETPLQQQAPSQQMPAKIDTSEWDIDGQQGISLKVITKAGLAFPGNTWSLGATPRVTWI